MASSAPIIDIEDCQFGETDKLFFDANIWLSLYCPQAIVKRADGEKSATYSRAFEKMLNAKCGIKTSMLVLSEVVNVWVKKEHAMYKDPEDSFDTLKNFRKKPEFKPIAESVAAGARKILAHSRLVKGGWSEGDIRSMVDVYREGESDFNDLAIARLCVDNRFTLVTDDGDFRGRPFPVITANQRLLNPRPR